MLQFLHPKSLRQQGPGSEDPSSIFVQQFWDTARLHRPLTRPFGLYTLVLPSWFSNIVRSPQNSNFSPHLLQALPPLSERTISEVSTSRNILH
jgi:hypothetical protein